MTRFLILLVFATGAEAPQADPELERYIQARSQEIDDTSRTSAARAELVAELVATIDRAARAAPSTIRRRELWERAASRIQDFERVLPDHPRREAFQVLEATLDWAIARTWIDDAEVKPNDAAAVKHARQSLDRAIPRLDSAALNEPEVESHRQYRLARALLDRAQLAESAADAKRDNERVLAATENIPASSPMAGYLNLARAEALTAIQRWDDATAALKQATESSAPPTSSEIAEQEISLFLGRKQFAAAREALDRAKLSRDDADPLRLRVVLAERLSLSERESLERLDPEILELLERIESRGGRVARAAGRAVARAVSQPANPANQRLWNKLVDGWISLEKNEEAAELAETAGSALSGAGETAAAARLRLRAAAIWINQNRIEDAERCLAPIVSSDSGADPETRERAGSLRILGHGRLAATKMGDGKVRAEYLKALADQLNAFPAGTSADEVRFRLGHEFLSDGKVEEARGLWLGIRPEGTSWLPARLALAELSRNGLVEETAAGRPTLDRENLARLRQDLEKASRDATTDEARVRLALAALELGLLDPQTSRERILEEARSIARKPLSPEARAAATTLEILALVALERYIEAEQAASRLVETADLPTLQVLARQLNRAARENPSDRVRNRIGPILELAAGRLARMPGLEPVAHAEALILLAEGNTHAGEFVDARRILAEERLRTNLPLPLDQDVAELAIVLGQFEDAIRRYRRHASSARPGSASWFDARLGQARALIAGSRTQDAGRLLEGTQLLYPDLGGPVVKERFRALQELVRRGSRRTP
jgi:hypothetical protein